MKRSTGSFQAGDALPTGTRTGLRRLGRLARRAL